MITRRTFASRAALFVLGCALQVSGVAALLKRRITDLTQLEIGMVFNDCRDPTQTWIIVDEGTYKILPDGTRQEVTNDRCLKWNCVKQGSNGVPELWCFCMPPSDHDDFLRKSNFRFLV